MTNPDGKIPRGRILVIAGCMFAGKTKRLIEELRRAEAGGRRCAAFKHALDDRYAPSALATHDGLQLPARPIATPEALLAEAGRADVIGIDEAHFFGRLLAGVIRQLRDKGRHVIAVGLDNDAWGRPFPPFPQLKEMADEIVLLRAPCTVCGEPAPYSQRMVPVTDEFMVGGLSEYEPRCAKCFVSLPPPAPEY